MSFEYWHPTHAEEDRCVTKKSSQGTEAPTHFRSGWEARKRRLGFDSTEYERNYEGVEMWDSGCHMIARCDGIGKKNESKFVIQRR